MPRFISTDITHTDRLAADIAALCKAPDCLLLRGDLGAGKTTFARAFIQALCDVKEEIVSPTFSLMQPYTTRSGGTLAHFDLYRLKHVAEIQELGLEEALQESICLIEWPQIIEDRWPREALLVDIGYGKNDDERVFTFECREPLWQTRLAGLKGLMP